MGGDPSDPLVIVSSSAGKIRRAYLRIVFSIDLPGLGGELLVAGMGSLLIRAVGMIATFVLGILLARYLGASELGLYGMVVAVAMLLAAIAQLGLPTLATREAAIAWSRGDFSELRGILLWFGLAATAAAIILGAGLALGATLWPRLTGSIGEAARIGALLVPLFALTVLISAELRALGRLVLGQSLELLVRPLMTCLLVLLWVLVFPSLTARVALEINVLASLIALLLATWWLVCRLPREARGCRPNHHFRKWGRSAAPLAITDVLRQLDGVYAILLMGFLVTTAETGIFRVAQSTMLFVATPLFVVQVVVAPSLARLHDSGDWSKLQRLVTISARLNFGAAVLGALVVAVAGPDLIGLVFGTEYRGAWMPLLILCVGQIVNRFFGVGFVLLPMAGAERELTFCFLVSVFVSVVCAVPLIIMWGSVGAAAAAIVGAAANGCTTHYFAKVRMGIDTSLFGSYSRHVRNL